MEQDTTWKIIWPATNVGYAALQKCPGGAEAEGNLYCNYDGVYFNMILQDLLQENV